MFKKPSLFSVLAGLGLAIVFLVAAALPAFGLLPNIVWVVFVFPGSIFPDALAGLLPGSGLNPLIALAPFAFLSFLFWWFVFTAGISCFVLRKPNIAVERTP